MKKVVAGIISVLAVVCLCLCLTACSSKVDGNTYLFDSVEVSGEGSDAIKDEISSMESFLKGTGLAFHDGKAYAVAGGEEVEIGEYTQDGDTVKIGEEELKVSGSKLIQEETEGGITVKTIYKKK